MKNQNKIFYIVSSILIVAICSCSSSPRFSRDSDKEYRNRGEEKTKEFRNYSVVATVSGLASYYADKYHGRTTANGETYDMYGLTAAHPTYPFGTIIRVTNLANNKSVQIRINDRMPKHPTRMIDLSLGTAKAIDMVTAGVQKVRLDILKWGKK